MSMDLIPDELLSKVAGGTDVALPPGFRGPWMPIVRPLPRPWPPLYSVDPIPAPPGMRPVEI